MLCVVGVWRGMWALPPGTVTLGSSTPRASVENSDAEESDNDDDGGCAEGAWCSASPLLLTVYAYVWPRPPTHPGSDDDEDSHVARQRAPRRRTACVVVSQ